MCQPKYYNSKHIYFVLCTLDDDFNLAKVHVPVQVVHQTSHLSPFVWYYKGLGT